MRTRASLLLACMLLPAIALAQAGSWYEDSAHLSSSLPEVGDTVWYTLPLEAGDTITVRLTWPDPTVSLVVEVESPTPVCEVAPSPDPACSVESLTDPSNLCPVAVSAPLAPSPVTVSGTVIESGLHRVVVTGFLAPLGSDFGVAIQVNGEAPAEVAKADTVIVSANNYDPDTCPSRL